MAAGSLKVARLSGITVANAARFPVFFGITSLQQSNSVGEGHALN